MIRRNDLQNVICKQNTILTLYVSATYKNVLFPGHNHLLTTDADDPVLSLIIAQVPARVIKIEGHYHRK